MVCRGKGAFSGTVKTSRMFIPSSSYYISPHRWSAPCCRGPCWLPPCRRCVRRIPAQTENIGWIENIFLLGDKNICLISWLRRWQEEEGPCSLLLLPYTLCPLIRGTHWRCCFKKHCCKIHHSLSPRWQFYGQKWGGAIQWCIWYILTGKPFIWIPE